MSSSSHEVTSLLLHGYMIHLSIQLLIDACLNDPHSMQSGTFDVLIHICTFSVRAITCICSASVSNAEQLSKVHWHQLCLSSHCPPATGTLKSVLGNKPSQNVKRHETIIIYFPQRCKCSGFLCVVLFVGLLGLCGYLHTHGIHSHRYTHIHRNTKKLGKRNPFTCWMGGSTQYHPKSYQSLTTTLSV